MILLYQQISGPTQVELMETGTWDIEVKNTGSQSGNGLYHKIV